MTNRGESAARGETVAPLPTDWELQKKPTSKPLQSKRKTPKEREDKCGLTHAKNLASGPPENTSTDQPPCSNYLKP
jgi:hypothetical protein